MKRRTFLGLLSALPFMAKAKEVEPIIIHDKAEPSPAYLAEKISESSSEYYEGLRSPKTGTFDHLKYVENMSVYQLEQSRMDSFRDANREMSRIRALAVEDLKIFNGDRWAE